MLLDNRTLLFSLMLVSGLMTLSLSVVARDQEHDGLKKWALAIALETVGWLLISLRDTIPDAVSILLANLLMATAQALKLAAYYEYRRRAWPRWQCLLPVAVAGLLFGLLPYSAHLPRIILGSAFYSMQLVLMLRALYADHESRTGRAWGLMFYSSIAMLAILVTRAVTAATNYIEFATHPSSITPNPIQLGVFAGIMAFAMLGSLGFILMIKERSDREMRSLAMTDPLTRIFNRRAFMAQAEKELASAERTGLPVAFLMIDIDHFKPVNDKYGHAVGDAVLIHVAQLLSTTLRKQDTLGRYGGEEFCILLPCTDDYGAVALADKLRRAVADTELDVGLERISVTISLGISVWDEGCEPSDCKRILAQADQALYQAKAGGRDRCVLFRQMHKTYRKLTAAGF